MEPVIQTNGLVKRYPGFQLGPLDLAVPGGGIYGFIGTNGAGKTTTIDLMLGMGQPDAGMISIFGLDHDKDEVAIKQETGYVGPELRFDAWGRIERLLKFWSSFYPNWDEQYCNSLLSRFSLKPGDKISTLSTGSRTKLSLVTALSHRPKLLLLDEPVIGLDAVSKRELFQELLEAVQNEDRTVFISSHNLEDLERFADHIGILNDGRLVTEGDTATLLERYARADLTVTNGFNPASIPGLHTKDLYGEHRQVLVDQHTDAPALLRAQFGEDLELQPVTLEEIFIGLAGAR